MSEYKRSIPKIDPYGASKTATYLPNIENELASIIYEAVRLLDHINCKCCKIDDHPNLLAKIIGHARQAWDLVPPLCHEENGDHEYLMESDFKLHCKICGKIYEE